MRTQISTHYTGNAKHCEQNDDNLPAMSADWDKDETLTNSSLRRQKMIVKVGVMTLELVRLRY